ncbi:ceramidase domain-containing protein [Hoeflea sp. BAL378]|uniref:ceramidase domain-containing protein n=1 Tax=Hoeflea sp. BAL378 TaxID=1547437 RepID=UPI00068E0816|nr:ceramidase domain-containing protein [Hoeflea sp. BAL378]
MTIDWNEPITGAYCERLAPGLLGEPLNALSSLLVLAISLLAFLHVMRRHAVTPGVMALMGLAIAISVGSLLLHTFATRWAELADVLPIWGFVAVYGAFALRNSPRRLAGVPLALVLGITVFIAGLVLSLRGTHMVGDTVSGSTQYLPALLVAVAGGRMLWRERHPSLRLIAIAAGLFVLSFSFRSLDIPLCGMFPAGTHFLWHITNCLAFGVLLAAMIRYPASDGTADRPQV